MIAGDGQNRGNRIQRKDQIRCFDREHDQEKRRDPQFAMPQVTADTAAATSARGFDRRASAGFMTHQPHGRQQQESPEDVLQPLKARQQ